MKSLIKVLLPALTVGCFLTGHIPEAIWFGTACVIWYVLPEWCSTKK